MPDPIRSSARIFTSGGGTEIELTATAFEDATYANRIYGGFGAIFVTAGRGDGQVTGQGYDADGGLVAVGALSLNPDASTQFVLRIENQGRRLAAVRINISEPNTPPQTESITFWVPDPKDDGSGSGGTGTGGTSVQHGGAVVATAVTRGALRGFQSGIHQGFTRDGNRSPMTAILSTSSTGGAQ